MPNIRSSHIVLLSLLAPALALSPEQQCTALARTRIQNAHSVDTLYLRANESYAIPAICGTNDLRARTTVNVCVANVVYNTSRTSATRVETWLPDADAWSGRVLGTGGGGMGGCVDYDNLAWGPALGWAGFGHDGGHDGPTGEAFMQSDEVLVDYASRGLHVATLAAKQLVRAYYDRPQDRTYYLGCSNGGRQGLRNAQDHPEDFDGILAGAPAINFIPLLAQGNIANEASHKLDVDDWALVRNELLRQCDGLDGVRDGIISDPDACQFVPETLLCTGEKHAGCLSVEQVEAVRTIHTPLYGQDGQLLAPRMDPGAELDDTFWPIIFGPSYYEFSLQWWRYAVYNDSTWTPSPDFGYKEIADAMEREKAVPVGSFNPDLSAFRKRGGKLLTYHGGRDILIPSGTSTWYYQMVQRALALPPAAMDDFYRLFLVPGMNHCFSGPGAWMIGQAVFGAWSNASDANALLALVEWVEHGKGPETLRGSTDGTGNATTPSTRLHCKYPARSVWKADLDDWECVQYP